MPRFIVERTFPDGLRIRVDCDSAEAGCGIIHEARVLDPSFHG